MAAGMPRATTEVSLKVRYMLPDETLTGSLCVVDGALSFESPPPRRERS
jgi:hypothetical protein